MSLSKPLPFFVSLGLAGALGTLLRYGLSQWVRGHHTLAFPLGTFLINTLGAFLFGAILGFNGHRHLLGLKAQGVLLIGFMGGFTTFSTFAFEGFELIQSGRLTVFFTYALGQNICGFLAVFLGLWLGSRV